ncbi:MAG: hydantoinase/oxoprolinase family protein [Gammaproteobacteria bacterium]|nr:hydantoinase/oxoprolinase family protein [Gammaproteobacteria bacterium]
MGYYVGIDVGGTFTDFFALDESSGRTCVLKRPSTPDDPARAILEGLVELAGREGIALDLVERVAHGTTVGTNALIQRRGGRVALITTAGFRDLLEIGRQTRPLMYDLQADHPPPLVPRERRFEVAERMGAEGAALRALDGESLDAAVTAVGDSRAEACAVCLLFAYLNPAHEQAVAAALARRLPDVAVSLSSEVQPEFREYERFSTTVLNAYLQPVMARYIANLEGGLARAVPGAVLGMNQSSGGLMSAERTQRFPVRTALSGPAAGAVGAAHVARMSGRARVVTLDMGGTSADVALVRDYHTDVAFERSVAGFPIRLPMVDIETVGAGGGSIAWFDRDGLLKVGPHSAGAVPGPACYAQGGEEATVTDANLVLGRLSPRGLVGGAMRLDIARARSALAPLAERLGMSAEAAAHGVVGIVVANMARTIRIISVERGHDVRRFALMPFGGAGPLHAREVAASLDMDEIVVPGAPGIVCAQGLVMSDLKEDFVASQRVLLDDGARAWLGDAVARLAEEATAWFALEKVPPARRRLELAFDMRYVGQNFELRVPVAAGEALGDDAVPDAPALAERFFAAHETAYGYHNPADAVEVMNIRLTARGRLQPAEPPAAAATRAPLPAPIEHREVWFDANAPVAAPIYDRATLETGHEIAGPAIIEQLDTTTPVHPGDLARVDAAGSLIIRLDGARRDGDGEKRP